jgi:hypothetical protein
VFDDSDYWEVPEAGFPGATLDEISVLGYKRDDNAVAKDLGNGITMM